MKDCFKSNGGGLSISIFAMKQRLLTEKIFNNQHLIFNAQVRIRDSLPFEFGLGGFAHPHILA
jgi:hypothetical protein